MIGCLAGTHFTLGEVDLQCETSSQLCDSWSKLAGITDPESFWIEALATFARIGFDQVIYAKSAAGGQSRQHAIQMRTSAGLDAWVNDYAAHGDARFDPMFSHGVFMPGPIFTGADNLPDHPYLTAREREVILRAGDHGFRSGIALPMLFTEPGVSGGWNLLCSAGRKETAAISNHLNGYLPAFSTLVQSRLEALDAQRPSPLTDREREVLLWLGRGERSDQIAHRLNIKPVTVSLHLKNARKKLGARTREQALGLAIVKGWIEP